MISVGSPLRLLGEVSLTLHPAGRARKGPAPVRITSVALSPQETDSLPSYSSTSKYQHTSLLKETRRLLLDNDTFRTSIEQYLSPGK